MKITLNLILIFFLFIVTAVFFDLKDAKEASKEYNQIRSDLELIIDVIDQNHVKRLYKENKDLDRYIQACIMQSKVKKPNDYEGELCNILGREILVKYVGNLKGAEGLVITVNNFITVLNE